MFSRVICHNEAWSNAYYIYTGSRPRRRVPTEAQSGQKTNTGSSGGYRCHQMLHTVPLRALQKCTAQKKEKRARGRGGGGHFNPR